LTKTFGNHEIHIGGGFITNKFLSPITTDNLQFGAQATADTNPNDLVNTGDPLASFLSTFRWEQTGATSLRKPVLAV